MPRHWKAETCFLCGRVTSWRRNKNEHAECTMISSGSLQMHLACKEIVAEGIYETLDYNLAAFTMQTLGLLQT